MCVRVEGFLWQGGEGAVGEEGGLTLQLPKNEGSITRQKYSNMKEEREELGGKGREVGGNVNWLCPSICPETWV